MKIRGVQHIIKYRYRFHLILETIIESQDIKE